MRRGNQIRCLTAVAIFLLARSLTAEKPPMAHNDVDRMRQFEAAWASSATIPLATAYASYPATYLIETADALRRQRSKREARELLSIVLERPVTECEKAEAKYLIHRVTDDGEIARQMLGEIVRDSPDHPRALSAARRLAELHHSVLITGTQPDPDTAIVILEWVVSRYPNDQDATLNCRVQLGNLYWAKRRWLEAQEQFLAIYNAPNESMSLPYDFIPGWVHVGALEIGRIQGSWAAYRPKLVQKIVGTCTSAPDRIEALGDLIKRYPGTDIEARARAKMDEVQKSQRTLSP